MEYDFSTQGKGVAISLISVTFIGFLFYFAVSIIIRKCNQKIWTISEVIVEIIVIFMFIITSVSVLSSAMLFLGGTLMCFILDSIKQIADRTWLKYTIVGVIAVVVVILLCVQYIGG